MTMTLKDLAAEELDSEDPIPAPTDYNPEWTQAEAYRKSGEYEKAGPYFFAQWTQDHEAEAGWRYAFCLRKAGHPEAALRAACRVLLSVPDNKPALQEKLWSLYEARVKPAVESQRHQQVLQYCLEMARAGADELALKIAAFASFKAAKETRQWSVVLEWCARLNAQKLSATPRKNDHRKGLSDRERYYYAKIKALVELQAWEQALVECEHAQQDFERNQDFKRWRAFSLAGLGDLQLALQGLEALRATGRCRWYILSDYARLLKDSEPAKAWEVALEAAAAQVEIGHKLGLFELMAEIALLLARDSAALDHVGWCVSLRNALGWPITSRLESLQQELSHLDPTWEPNDCEYWENRARMHWGLQPTKAEKRQKGQIEQITPGRNYCFVMHEGQRFYTLLKDVPPHCRQDGCWVHFQLISHYDAKKQAESRRAVQLSAA
ncbi:MAG: hypothetical protein U0931_42090 [Vulcanimicrobiota bacterium]